MLQNMSYIHLENRLVQKKKYPDSEKTLVRWLLNQRKACLAFFNEFFHLYYNLTAFSEIYIISFADLTI
jgi:hypothetical protein